MTTLLPVQTVTGMQQNLSTATSASFPVNTTTAGNLLVIFVSCNQFYASTIHVGSIADTGSNTWTQRGTTSYSGTGANNVSSQVFTVENAASINSFTVTTVGDASIVAVTFIEVQGVGTSATDTTNNGTATSVTTVTSTLTAPSQSGDLVLHYAAVGTVSTSGINHVQDDKVQIANNSAPYPGTTTAGVSSSLVAVVGSPAVATSTTFTSPATQNYAWSAISLKASAPQIGPLYTVANGQTIQAKDVNQVVNLLSGNTSGQLYVAGAIQAALSGATGQGRYVGGSNGAPTTGTFLTGDWVTDYTTQVIWICTAGGTPGTWKRIGTGGYLCRVANAGGQNFTSANSFQVTFSATPTFDPRSMFVSASNSIQLPYAGKWLIGGGVTCASSGASGDGFFVSIYGNGSEISRGTSAPIPASGNFGGIVTDLVQASANELITLECLFYNGATVTGNTSAGFLFACAMDA